MPTVLNIPVVKLPPNVKVPAVSVYVPVAVSEYVLLNVTSPIFCKNVATELSTDVPLCVYEPLLPTVKLTDGVIVPVE